MPTCALDARSGGVNVAGPNRSHLGRARRGSTQSSPRVPGAPRGGRAASRARELHRVRFQFESRRVVNTLRWRGLTRRLAIPPRRRPFLVRTPCVRGPSGQRARGNRSRCWIRGVGQEWDLGLQDGFCSNPGGVPVLRERRGLLAFMALAAIGIVLFMTLLFGSHDPRSSNVNRLGHTPSRTPADREPSSPAVPSQGGAREAMAEQRKGGAPETPSNPNGGAWKTPSNPRGKALKAPSDPKVESDSKWGSIRGVVLDFNGVPLAKVRVTFWQEDARSRAYTDSKGNYFIDRIEMGRWNACFALPERHPDAATFEAGVVEILEGQSANFDFVVPGVRKLSGVILLSESDVSRTDRIPGSFFVFSLELRKRADPERIVGLASAKTPAEDPARSWTSALP